MKHLLTLLTVATALTLSGCYTHSGDVTEPTRARKAADQVADDLARWPGFRDNVVMGTLKHSANLEAHPVFEAWMQSEIATRLRQRGIRVIYESDWNHDTHEINAILTGEYTLTNDNVHVAIHAVSPTPSGKSISAARFQLPLTDEVRNTL